MKVTPEMIRQKYKSVLAFSRMLKVTPASVYKAINGGASMDKLRKKIYEFMEVEQ